MCSAPASGARSAETNRKTAAGSSGDGSGAPAPASRLSKLLIKTNDPGPSARNRKSPTSGSPRASRSTASRSSSAARSWWCSPRRTPINWLKGTSTGAMTPLMRWSRRPHRSGQRLASDESASLPAEVAEAIRPEGTAETDPA
jgi:hypothetical protein